MCLCEWIFGVYLNCLNCLFVCVEMVMIKCTGSFKIGRQMNEKKKKL